MGFFDSLAKAASSAGASIKKANIDKIEKLWKDMDRLSTSRLADLCKERGVDDMAGCLAFLKLRQKGSQHSVSLNSEEMESVRDKADFIKRTIELSEGRAFSEIRETMNGL
ncbi:hypothetical protein [uncultured Sphaerotilus sp.]|uniref:hypothetical protein n=1 Tax=uncultured Sphaerotilus sp. TaxID=474984 RepID=UPI0030CA3015